MNIFILILFLSFSDIPELPAQPRADRRASRDNAIAHNRTVYHNRVGRDKWFDRPYRDQAHFKIHHPEWNGLYVPYPYKDGYAYKKAQSGRWATERLSGHRRYQKWCRDYYSSRIDEIGKAKFVEALEDYYRETP